MMKLRIALVVSCLLTVNLASASDETYVRQIEIVRRNVFDDHSETSDHFIFKYANKFHIVTRERIIRQELLFHEGEPFDLEMLEQSLRNIRTLQFIGEASYITRQVGNDSIDVEIITEDLWTTTAGISGEGGGGRYIVGAYASEGNLAGLGLGIDANVQFTTDEDNGYSLFFADRRFFGTRLFTQLLVANLAYSDQLSFAVTKPFYSQATRWSFGGSVNDQSARPRIFHEGSEIFRYRHDYTSLGFSVMRAFGQYTRMEPGLTIAYYTSDYSPLPEYGMSSIIPHDESFGGPGATMKLSTYRYFTGRYLDEFGTTEDLTEHLTLDLGATWSGPTFSGDYEATYLSVRLGAFGRPFRGAYFGVKNSYSNYFTGQGRERISNDLESIAYLKPGPEHLLALRLLSRFAWRQLPDYQLVLGGINGLRGYPDRYFEGTKLALCNLEYRYFSPIEILTVGLGAAAFFDAGYVWNSGQKFDLRDLKRDVGIGLRLGLTKSSTARTIRLDLARALDQDNWYLSFSTENLFALENFQ